VTGNCRIRCPLTCGHGSFYITQADSHRASVSSEQDSPIEFGAVTPSALARAEKLSLHDHGEVTQTSRWNPRCEPRPRRASR